MKLLIIGSGNMGLTFAKSFLSTHQIESSNLYILERSEDKAILLREEQVGEIRGVPGPFFKECDLIILAVKPQDIEELFPVIRPHIDDQQLILSIMAGVSMTSLRDGLGVSKIVRCMPNLPAQIGYGMSVFTSTDEVTREELVTVQNLLNATGRVVYVEQEDMIDAATAVSGSGPAYVFFFMREMIKAAEQLGFSQSQAEQLVFQTFRGAVELYGKYDYDCSEWISKVSSKGGTTEAAFEILDKKQVGKGVKEAIFRAKERALELSKRN